MTDSLPTHELLAELDRVEAVVRSEALTPAQLLEAMRQVALVHIELARRTASPARAIDIERELRRLEIRRAHGT